MNQAKNIGPFDDSEVTAPNMENPFADSPIINPFLDEPEDQVITSQVRLAPVNLGGGDENLTMLPLNLRLPGVLNTESQPNSHPLSVLTDPNSGELKKAAALQEQGQEVPTEMMKSFKFKDPKVDEIEYHTPAARQHEGEHIPFRKSTEQPVEDIQQEHYVRGLLQINQVGKCMTVLRLEGVLEVNASNCCIIIQENFGLVDLRGFNNVLRITRKDKLGIVRNSGKNNQFQLQPVATGWCYPTPAFENVQASYRNHYCDVLPPDPADAPKEIIYSPVISQNQSMVVSIIQEAPAKNPFEAQAPTQKHSTRMASSELQDHSIQPLPEARKQEPAQEPTERDMLQRSAQKTPFDQDSSEELPPAKTDQIPVKKRQSLLIPHLQFTTGPHTVELVKKTEEPKKSDEIKKIVEPKETRVQTAESGSQELHKQSVEEKQRYQSASKVIRVAKLPEESELDHSQELPAPRSSVQLKPQIFGGFNSQQQTQPPKTTSLSNRPFQPTVSKPEPKQGLEPRPVRDYDPWTARNLKGSYGRHTGLEPEGFMMDDDEDIARMQRLVASRRLAAPEPPRHVGHRHPHRYQHAQHRLYEEVFAEEPVKKIRKIQTHEVVAGKTSIKHDCPICYEEFDKTDFGASYLDCGHWFHYRCLNPWFEANDTCPECKEKVKTCSLIVPGN